MNRVAFWTWAGCCVGVLVTACGELSTSEDALGGAAGEPTQPPNESGGVGAAGAAGETAGGGGRLVGEGGAPSSDSRVQAAAETGLNAQDVVLDGSLLAGHSFTLTSSLCVAEGDGGEGNIGGGPGSGNPLPIIHVREGQAGGLEAVTFTEDGGLPLLEVTPMRQTSLGWSLADVATCAGLYYVFEESYSTERYRTPEMHIVFVKTAASSALRAVVAASAGRGVRVSQAELDELPPVLYALDLEGRYEVDGVANSGFTRHFLFSEPLPAGTEVTLEGDEGAAVEIEPREQEGYLVGFSVSDLLSDDFEIGGQLQDLAGNVATSPMPYPGIRLTPADGTFEQPASFIDQTAWDADETTNCETGTFASVEDLQLPALTGGKSFLSGSASADCPAWLRVRLAPGDTELVFEARLIGAASGAPVAPLRVCTSSLGVGGDDVCTTLEEGWTLDPDYPAAKPRVSEVRSITVALPDGASEILLELAPGAGQRVWIDSLRTQ